MMTKLYLYGVVRPNDTSHSEELTQLHISDITTEINLQFFGQLGLVFSEREMEEDEEVRPTRKNLINHQKVIEGVMNDYLILPFRFGMVVDDSSKLEALITEQKDAFLKKLEQIDGKIELSLKSIWMNMEQVFEEVVRDSPTIQQKREELFASEYQDQNAKIELGKMVEDALNNKKTEIQIKIVNKLFEKAVDYKSLKNISEEMIANLVFLVEKKDEVLFDEAVNELSEELSENIKFKYVGPMPPYNFLEA